MIRTAVDDAVEGNEEQDEEYSDNFEDENSPEAEPLDTEDPPRPSAPVRTVWRQWWRRRISFFKKLLSACTLNRVHHGLSAQGRDVQSWVKITQG